jgi:hypothetical protein
MHLELRSFVRLVKEQALNQVAACVQHLKFHGTHGSNQTVARGDANPAANPVTAFFLQLHPAFSNGRVALITPIRAIVRLQLLK